MSNTDIIIIIVLFMFWMMFGTTYSLITGIGLANGLISGFVFFILSAGLLLDGDN